jgi:hypothetical protein
LHFTLNIHIHFKCLLYLRNEQEIENIIKSNENKNILSPSNFYLNFQGLSIDDQSYLEYQDKARLLKFKNISQKAKAKFVEPNKFIKNLNELKESREELKVSFFIRPKVKRIQEQGSFESKLSSM